MGDGKQQFIKKESYIPASKQEQLLVEAFALLRDTDESGAFLRDLLTPKEIEEFANRLEIARLLMVGGMSYQEIAKEVGTSTTTVTRVAHWLFNGCGGYWQTLQKLNKDNPKHKK